jgi:hypothetical protein
MENGKGTSREKELLGATDVAELIGVKETTVTGGARRASCLA